MNQTLKEEKKKTRKRGTKEKEEKNSQKLFDSIFSSTGDGMGKKRRRSRGGQPVHAKYINNFANCASRR